MKKSEVGQNGDRRYINRSDRRNGGKTPYLQPNDLPGTVISHSPRTTNKNKKTLPNGIKAKVIPAQEKIKNDTGREIIWGAFQWASADKGDKSEKSKDTERGWLCGLCPSKSKPNTTDGTGTGPKKTKFHRMSLKTNENGKLKTMQADVLAKRWGNTSDPKEHTTTSMNAPRLVVSFVALGENAIKPKIQSVRRLANELITFVADTDSWLLVQGDLNSEIFRYVGDALGNHQLVGKDKFTTVIAVSPWPEIIEEDICNNKKENQREKEHASVFLQDRTKTDEIIIVYDIKEKSSRKDEQTRGDKNHNTNKEEKSRSRSGTNSSSKVNIEKHTDGQDTESPRKPIAKRIELNPNIKNYIFCDDNSDKGNLKHLVDLTKDDNASSKTPEEDKDIQKRDQASKEDDCKLYKCMILVAGQSSCVDIIKDAVEKKIPVILVKGLGGLSDTFCDVVEKKKTTVSPEKSSGITDRDIAKINSIALWDDKSKSLLHVYDIETKSEKASLAAEILDAVITLETGEKAKSTAGSEAKQSKADKKTMLELCIDANEFNLAEKKELIPKDCNNLDTSTVLKSVIHDRGIFADFFLAHGLDLKRHFTSDDIKEELKKMSTEKSKDHQIDDIHSAIPPEIGYFYKPPPKTEAPTINDLFVWSILHEKFEFARAVWDHVEQPTLAALLAFGLIRKKALRNTHYTMKSDTLDKYKKEFANLAEENIKAWYKKDPEEVYVFLRGKIPLWGNTSCIGLATETRNKSFLALEPCYILQERVWIWGDNITPDEQNDRYKKKGNLFPITSGDVMSMFSPRIMYCFNFLGFVLFLMAYALFIISRLTRDRFHFLEWILWVFIFTLFLQEIFQLHQAYTDQKPEQDEEKQRTEAKKEQDDGKQSTEARKEQDDGKQSTEEKKGGVPGYSRTKLFRSAVWEYQKDHFNKVDILSLLLFIVAWFSRLVAYYRPQEQYWMDAARTLFSFDFIIFMLRLLRYCYISHQLGPMVLMISHMLATLFRFLIILSLFFLAYAIGSEAVLYPESKMSWQLVFHILRKAYWNMFGELFLDEIDADGSDQCTACTDNPDIYNTYEVLRCPSQIGRYVVPVMLGTYLLIVNILMFSLLIAQFSSAILQIESNSKNEWSYQRSLMLREFSRSILPFPFTIFNILLYVVGRGHYADSDPFFYNPPPPKEGSNIPIKKPSTQKQEAQEKEAVAMQNDQTKTEVETAIDRVMDTRVIPLLYNIYYKEHTCCYQKEHAERESGDLNKRVTELEHALKRLENRKRDELELRMDETYRRRQIHSQSWDTSPPTPPVKRSFSVETSPDRSRSHFQVIPK